MRSGQRRLSGPPPLVVHIITQLELGGAQLAALSQCRNSRFGLPERYLIAGPGGPLWETARAQLGCRLLLAPALQRHLRPPRDLRAYAQLWRLLQRLRRRHRGAPLLVHTHSSKAGILGRWAARRAGARWVVHSVHGFGHQRAHMPDGVFAALRAAEWLTARRTDAFTLDSFANLSRACAEGLVRRQPVAVVPCNVDLAPPPAGAAAALRAQLGLRPDEAVVLQVGCLKPQKDPLTFVQVAARVRARCPNVRFVLAGDGVLRPQLRAAVQAAGLQDAVLLLGWRRDVATLLQLCDVVVLTSLWEGMPQVFGQAMAARRPLVATCVDGAAEAIEDGVTGFLRPPADAPGLAAAVLTLLRSPRLRAAMGARAQRRAQAFGEAAMLRRLDAFYARLCGA